MNYNHKIYNDYQVITVTEKKQYGQKQRSKETKKSLKSLQRARRNMLEIFELNLTLGDLVITITYKENITNYNISYMLFNKFIKRLKYKYKDIEYIAIKEKQKRGAIHYHVVLFLYGQNYNISLVEIIKTWQNGRCDIDIIDDNNFYSVPFYFTKYLTDYEKGQIIDADKKFFQCSRGIKRIKKQKITRFQLEKMLKNNNHIKIVKKNYTKFILPLDKD